MPVVEHKLHADKAGSRAVEAFSKGFSSLCHLSVTTKKAAYVPTGKLFLLMTLLTLGVCFPSYETVLTWTTQS